jgi:hypothetical protein
MISFGFKTLHIWIRNIKKEVGLHTNPAISIWSCALQHSEDVFFLQDVGEINGTQVPFTIGIQTPTQCESMLSYGHNGAISMDGTFGTNDMKFHLFTLMGFDDRCTGVLLAWIITSRQTIQDLIEWLKPFKDKMLSHMPHWKPSCFLVDDALQELKALRLVLYLRPILYLFLYMFFDIFHKILDYFKCILCCINPIHSWRFYCMCPY